MGRYVLAVSSAFLGLACFVLVALGPVAAQQVLENIAAAEAMYQDFPPKETLPPEELAVVLDIWDAALESNDLRAISDAINTVTHGVPRPYRLRGAHVLRYDNPEIEDRLIELYLGEMENMQLLIQDATMADIGIVVPDTGGELWEGYADYLDGLVGPALFTFSPRIYEAVLGNGWGLTSGLVYLSTVNPEHTLGLLLDTIPRERTNLNQSPDLLDLPISRKAYTVHLCP